MRLAKTNQIGGGTGYNIEAMQAYLDVPVPAFFSAIYLVDLSPSLCEIARKRFARLGWHVHVICQDARAFRLEDPTNGRDMESAATYVTGHHGPRLHADLITMSYSLSMIPDYYSVVDSLSGLLAPGGLVGVVDFYVQSIVETAGRNYIGGSFNRHVNWLSRVIWRSWFDCDRVGLEGARRVSSWNDKVDSFCVSDKGIIRITSNIGLERKNPWTKETTCWEGFHTTSFLGPTVSFPSRRPTCWKA